MNTNQLPPPNSHIQNNKRLKEFDALRGFSMLSVVYMHVLLSAGVGGNQTISGSIIVMFFMPLFFFISGFFAFKMVERWNVESLKRVFVQKFKAQIVCPIVFYALLYYSRDANPIGWIEHGFGAYWFTIALFQMFVVYILTTIISRHLNRDIVIPFMILASIVGLITLKLTNFGDKCFFDITGSSEVCYFLQFFTVGLIARRFSSKFIRIVNSDRIKTIIFMSYILTLCIIYSEWGQSNKALATILNMVGSYLSLLTVTILFICGREFFIGKTRIAKALCFTGRRTLDIYMLHYFFLPSLPIVGVWIAPNSMVLFQLIYGLSTAIVITAICLLLSWCLRTSPVLADWLFGVREKKQIA